MDILALSTTEQRRLERLAAAASRTPKAMLKHVLRDGFDYCEHVVAHTGHTLIYRIIPSRIQILRFLHQRMNYR